MNSVLENILNHGYITVFLFVLAEQIGIPLPASLILLGAGALAGLHRMSFGIVIVVTVIASLIGDSIWFLLGMATRRHDSCFDLPRHASMSDLFFSDELAV